jgi:hypothetical protein
MAGMSTFERHLIKVRCDEKRRRYIEDGGRLGGSHAMASRATEFEACINSNRKLRLTLLEMVKQWRGVGRLHPKAERLLTRCDLRRSVRAETAGNFSRDAYSCGVHPPEGVESEVT